ncbi:MAG: cation:proton antiporter [Steroidobacteraceae bacterium]
MNRRVLRHGSAPTRTNCCSSSLWLELTLIVGAGRIGGAIAKRYGQSPAVGEIIIGVLLGPSLFGWIAPHAFNFVFRSAPPEPLQILSSLGLVLLMFQIGLEFDFSQLMRRTNRTAVLRVSLACLALPFSSGFVLGLFMTPGAMSPAARVDSALFVATAFSITVA